jgi:hypothetical protein
MQFMPRLPNFTNKPTDETCYPQRNKAKEASKDQNKRHCPHAAGPLHAVTAAVVTA